MNYDTLVKTIKAYVENDFPDTIGSGDLTSTEQINTFIQQAEKRVYAEVQLPDFRRSQIGNTAASNRFLTVPADWISAYSLAVIDGSGNYNYLLNKEPEYVREAYPNPATEGLPRYYAVLDDDSIVLGPTPDAVYSVQMDYFYYPESIVTATTTWLGDNYDQILLYGSLLEAYTFMKGEQDVIQMYQMRYDTAMKELKEIGEGRNRRDQYRSQPLRQPVD